MRTLSLLLLAVLGLQVLECDRSLAADGRQVELTVQTKSTGDALGVSADGKLAAVGNGNVVQLWDIERGRLIRKFAAAPNGELLNKIFFLPNSRLLVATVTNKPQFTLSDYQTGQLLKLHTVAGTAGAFSIEDAYVTAAGHLATAGNISNHPALWDIQTGRKILEFFEPGPAPHARGIIGLRNSVKEIAVSPDGKLLVGRASTSGRLALFETRTGRFLRALVAPEPRDYRHTSVLTFSQDGRTILESAYGDDDGQSLHFWDVATGARTRTFYHGDLYKYDRSVVLANSRHVVSRFSLEGPLKGQVAVWDIETKALIRVLHTASNFYVLPGGNTIVTADSTWGLDVKSLSNGLSLLPRSTMALWQGLGSFLSPDELLIAGRAGNEGMRGAVLNVRTGALVGPHDCFPTDHNLFKLQRSLLNCTNGYQIQGYSNGQILANVSRTEGAYPVGMTERELVEFDGSNSLLRKDLATGFARTVKVARTVLDPEVSLTIDALSSDGRLLVGRELSLYTTGLFKVWDAHTGRHLFDLADPKATVRLPNGPARQTHYSSNYALAHEAAKVIVTVGTVAWNSADLALMSGRSEAKIWSGDNGRLLKTVPLGRKNVRKIYETIEGSNVALLFWDGAVAQLDLRTLVLREILGPLPGSSLGVAWGQDGLKYQFLDGGTVAIRQDGTAGVLASTVVSEAGEWITITPEGFFTSSPNGGNMLWVTRGMEMMSIKQMFSVLYNPDLVRAKLDGDPNGEVRKAAAHLDLAKVLNSGPPPKIKVNLSQSTPDLVQVTVDLEATAGGVGRVEWRVNGLTVGVDSNQGGGTQLAREVALDAGSNLIEAVAYNKVNLIASEPALWRVEGPLERTAKGRLYVLAVGINSYTDPGYRGSDGRFERAPPLGLAVGDAKAVAAAFRQSGRGLYEEVITTLVLDAEATRSGLEDAVGRLASKIRPADTFVMFVASHGRSDNGRFFIIPSDFRSGPNALAEQGIGQGMLQDWIANKIRARRTVLLLDTCESGAAVSGHLEVTAGAPVTEASMGRLHEATGRPVLTASAAGQAALEGYKGHGLFSYAILDALKNADRNNNQAIELSELASYVQTVVPKLSPQLLEKGEVPFVQQPRFGSRGEDFALAGRLQ